MCRALYEKGVRAFVSFVQSYSKHECGLLFQVKGRWSLWVGHMGRASRLVGEGSYGGLKPVTVSLQS